MSSRTKQRQIDRNNKRNEINKKTGILIIRTRTINYKNVINNIDDVATTTAFCINYDDDDDV